LSNHLYLLLALVGAIGIFVGLGIRMVTAVTFNDPGCDPTAIDGPGKCNVTGPLILNPVDPTIEQVIGSPIQIGTLAAPRITTLFGTMQLSDNSAITTGSSHLGNSINVASTNDYAIVGSSSSSSFAGIFAANTAASGGQPGISATSTSGYGIEINSTSGKAAKFTGLVDIFGNVTIGTAADHVAFTVNGGEVDPVTGTTGVIPNSTVTSVTAAATNTTDDNDIATVDLRAALFPGHEYRVNSIDVLYARSVTPPAVRAWVPLPAERISYAECKAVGSSWNEWDGNVKLTNTEAFAVDFRIIVNYSIATNPCGGVDQIKPQITALSGITANNWYRSYCYTNTTPPVLTNPTTPVICTTDAQCGSGNSCRTNLELSVTSSDQGGTIANPEPIGSGVVSVDYYVYHRRRNLPSSPSTLAPEVAGDTVKLGTSTSGGTFPLRINATAITATAPQSGVFPPGYNTTVPRSSYLTGYGISCNTLLLNPPIGQIIDFYYVYAIATDAAGNTSVAFPGSGQTGRYMCIRGGVSTPPEGASLGRPCNTYLCDSSTAPAAIGQCCNGSCVANNLTCGGGSGPI
jgi:hypothetical protein